MIAGNENILQLFNNKKSLAIGHFGSNFFSLTPANALSVEFDLSFSYAGGNKPGDRTISRVIGDRKTTGNAELESRKGKMSMQFYSSWLMTRIINLLVNVSSGADRFDIDSFVSFVDGIDNSVISSIIAIFSCQFALQSFNVRSLERLFHYILEYIVNLSLFIGS